MPLYFSGEMIYPFLFDLFPELEKLKTVADILAKYGGWPDLYDEWQLARNEVPLYAATFVDDMYVDFGLAQETVSQIFRAFFTPLDTSRVSTSRKHLKPMGIHRPSCSNTSNI